MIGETKFKVEGRLDADGNVAVTVFGECSYGSRVASQSVEVTDEKLLANVSKALEKAVDAVRPDLTQAATASAYEALVVATKLGEKI